MVKKAKPSKKKSPRKKNVPSLSRSALRNLGATSFSTTTMAANSPTHKKGSAIIAPGPNGTTIICFFNDNTGNFDDCHTVQGKVGIIPNA